MFEQALNTILAASNAAGASRWCENCEERWITEEVLGKTRRFPVPCPHRMAERERQDAERERQQSYLIRAAHLGRLLPPRAYAGLRLADVRPNGANAEGLRGARVFLDSWEERAKDGRGLFFTGGVGTTKTVIANAVANELDARHWLPVVITSPALMAALMGKDADAMRSACRSCDLLVLDELGAESLTEWGAGQLFEIVDTRYREAKPMLVTSNLGKTSLIETWARALTEGRSRMSREQAQVTAQRIISRLSERCATVKFEGQDGRRSERHDWLTVIDGGKEGK